MMLKNWAASLNWNKRQKPVLSRTSLYHTPHPKTERYLYACTLAQYLFHTKQSIRWFDRRSFVFEEKNSSNIKENPNQHISTQHNTNTFRSVYALEFFWSVVLLDSWFCVPDYITHNKIEQFLFYLCIVDSRFYDLMSVLLLLMRFCVLCVVLCYFILKFHFSFLISSIWFFLHSSQFDVISSLYLFMFMLLCLTTSPVQSHRFPFKTKTHVTILNTHTYAIFLFQVFSFFFQLNVNTIPNLFYVFFSSSSIRSRSFC